MKDGTVHVVKISYASDTLNVYIDSIATPALSVSVDLSSLLSLDSGKAWIGFTSGTGLAFEAHDILLWEFSTSPTALDNSMMAYSLPLGTNSIILKWTPNQKAWQYRIYRSTTSSTSAFTPINVVVPPSTTFLDSNLTPNTLFFYKVTFLDSNYVESRASNVTQSTTFFLLSSTPAANKQASLSWQSVPSATHYQILAAAASDSNSFILLDSTTSTNYLTKTLQGIPYLVKVYAIGTNNDFVNQSNVIYTTPTGGGVKVTFQADISDFIRAGFDPSQDTLEVRGDTYPLSWYNGTTMLPEVSNSSVDSLTVTFYVTPGSIINYKFHALPEAKFQNTGWELGSNVSFNLSSADTVLLPRKPSILTGILRHGYEKPSAYTLFQNYPNPFNPSTVIGFQVPSSGFVSLKVYDVLGREVATLVNEREKAGSYSVTFDAGNLPSGVYFYRITAGSFVETKKLVVLR